MKPKPLTAYNQAIKDAADKRARAVAKMKNSGLTFEQIGDKLGITRQRAHEIYCRATALQNVA